ncbi:hypothetical protein GXY_13543 [Novacetimonas hansenii ATCC 23769]|uniref:Uncharacterized protein n=1 Tax=Novacetimonas hansenii ATCC 23769 TaxID=714995 RepID=D5QHT0_NOVHA|nr:hypothetical protein GXY_13543 [Novacetimonas hansenii ATCC 23769]
MNIYVENKGNMHSATHRGILRRTKNKRFAYF